MPLEIAFADGFDHYVASVNNGQLLGLASQWNVNLVSGSNSSYMSFVTGFRGRGKAVKFVADAFAIRMQRNIPSGQTKFSQHLAFRGDVWDADNTRSFLTWRDSAATTQCSLKFLANNTLGLFRGSTQLAATSKVFNESVVHRLNIAIDITDPNLSSFQMWVDGNLADGIDLSGADILNDASNTIDMFAIGVDGGGANVINCAYTVDDCMVCYGEAVNIGEMELVTDVPTSDVQEQWTPLSGTDNFAMVDELPPNLDTDYNSSAVVGNIDLQGFPALPTATDSIFALTQIFGAKKEEAGTRAIAAVAGLDVNYEGPQLNLTTDYDWYYKHYLTNPETTAAWLAAERAAASFGYKDAA